MTWSRLGSSSGCVSNVAAGPGLGVTVTCAFTHSGPNRRIARTITPAEIRSAHTRASRVGMSHPRKSIAGGGVVTGGVVTGGTLVVATDGTGAVITRGTVVVVACGGTVVVVVEGGTVVVVVVGDSVVVVVDSVVVVVMVVVVVVMVVVVVNCAAQGGCTDVRHDDGGSDTQHTAGSLVQISGPPCSGVIHTPGASGTPDP